MRVLAMLLITLLSSCSNNQKFDKSKWLEQDDIKQFPYRKKMLDDLLTNHKITGLSYNQLSNLLGEPEHKSNNDTSFIYYDILTEYGSDIDPIHTKTLKIKLTQDSIIENFAIEEWRK